MTRSKQPYRIDWLKVFGLLLPCLVSAALVSTAIIVAVNATLALF